VTFKVITDEFVIDQASVERKLSRINIFKSPGPDRMPNWIRRDFCAQLARPVCAIFNASVRQGFVPAKWKEATIVPLPKNHPPRSIQSDLRPISSIATLGKILESFIGTWILERVGDTLDNRQFFLFHILLKISSRPIFYIRVFLISSIVLDMDIYVLSCM